MTSNIGSRQLKDFGTGVGFNTSTRQSNSSELARGVIENALKKSFAPEFLNRIDDVMIFNSLSRDDIQKIIEIELQELYNRIHNLGYKIRVSAAAKSFIADKGYDEQFGARPLKRAIQKYIEDNLAEEIIKSSLSEGDIIQIDYDEKKEDVRIKIKKGQSKPKLPESTTGIIDKN